MANRKAGLSAGPSAIAAADSSRCSCGLEFVDDWEQLKHQVLGLHRYQSVQRSESHLHFEPLAAVRELPTVDIRPKCHRCLKSADVDELVILDQRYFHRDRKSCAA